MVKTADPLAVRHTVTFIGQDERGASVAFFVRFEKGELHGLPLIDICAMYVRFFE